MASAGRAPAAPVGVGQYTPRQRGRLTVKPGITGWAQVNGRTDLPWDERIELDLWYIEHRSWRLDLQILWRTARMVLGGHGLYRGETPAWRDPPPPSSALPPSSTDARTTPLSPAVGTIGSTAAIALRWWRTSASNSRQPSQ